MTETLTELENRHAAEWAAKVEELTGDVFEKVLEDERQTVGVMARVTRAIASEFDMTEAELRGPSRKRPLQLPRRIIWRTLRRADPDTFTLEKIGQFFGGRDHTSILHGLQQLERQEQQKTRKAA